MIQQYRVSIQIFPAELGIAQFELQLSENIELSFLYSFILQTFQDKIYIKNWQVWKAKSDITDIFAYSQELQISKIFGDVRIATLKIYTDPTQTPGSSILDIFNTQQKQTINNQNNLQFNTNPEEIKQINIQFIILDGLNQTKSSLKYSCQTNTIFSEALKALYCYLTINQEIAQIDFYLERQILKISESQTFEQLNIVSDTDIIVKIRWFGGYFNDILLLQSSI